MLWNGCYTVTIQKLVNKVWIVTVFFAYKEASEVDLFEYMKQTNLEKEAPLAARLRPTTLDEVVGQSHIIGKDKLLYRAIKADKFNF